MSRTNEQEVLKDLLACLKDLPFYTPNRKIELAHNIYFDNGYILVLKLGGKKQTRYKVATFFTSYKRMDHKLLRGMLENLNDYHLLLKLERNTLQAHDIVTCLNATIRRHLLASYGYEKFFNAMSGEVVDRHGSSELIRLRWHSDEEPLVMVKVKDSTTHKHYLLRVPPDMVSCKQAIAWTFDLDEDDYDPLKET